MNKDILKSKKFKIGAGVVGASLLAAAIITPILILNSNRSSNIKETDLNNFDKTITTMYQRSRRILKRYDRVEAQTYTVQEIKELTGIEYLPNKYPGYTTPALSSEILTNKAYMEAIYQLNFMMMRDFQADGTGGIFNTKIIAGTKDISNNNLKKHQAADIQWGKIDASTQAVSKEIVLDKKMTGNQMMGLFAPAGEYINIDFPNMTDDEVKALNISVHLGWNEHEETPKAEWLSGVSKVSKRMPIPFKKVQITHNNFKIGTPFGGTIALVINQNKPLSKNTKVIIDGGIEELEYIHGYTTQENWEDQISRGIQSPFVSMSNDFMNAVTLIEDDFTNLEEYPYKNMVLVNKIFQIGEWVRFGQMERSRTYDITGSAYIKYGAAYCAGQIIVVSPYSWIRSLFNYSSNINAPNWGIYHEINHGYQQIINGYYIGLPDSVEITNNILNILNFQLLSNVNLDRLGDDGSYLQTGWNPYNNPFGSLANYEEKVKTRTSNPNLEFYTSIMHATGIKRQLNWMRSYGVVPPKQFVNPTVDQRNARAIMETLVRIAEHTGYDMRNFLNESYGQNISIESKSTLGQAIREETDYQSYLNNGLKSGKFKKFNSVGSVYSSKSTNIFGQVIETGKPFMISPLKPFIFALKDSTKTKIYNGKRIKWDSSGNLLTSQTVINSIPSIADPEISYVGKPYDLVNIKEMKELGNGQYEYNPKDSNLLQKTSFKYDIFIRDQSYVTSSNEEPISPSNAFIPGQENIGWNKFTQTVEFNFKSYFAKEITYKTPTNIYDGTSTIEQKLRKAIELASSEQTLRTSRDIDKIENVNYQGIDIKSVSLKMQAPHDGYYKFQTKIDDMGAMWTSKTGLDITKDKPILISEIWNAWSSTETEIFLKKDETIELFILALNNPGVNAPGNYNIKYTYSKNNKDWKSYSFKESNTLRLDNYQDIVLPAPPVPEIDTIVKRKNYNKEINSKKSNWTISNPTKNAVYSGKIESIIDNSTTTEWQPKWVADKPVAVIKVNFNEILKFKFLNFLFIDRADRWPSYIKVKYLEAGKWYDFTNQKEIIGGESDFTQVNKSEVTSKEFLIANGNGNQEFVNASELMFEFNLDKGSFVNMLELDLFGSYWKYNTIFSPTSSNIEYLGKWETLRIDGAQSNNSLIISESINASITFNLKDTSYFQIHSLRGEEYGDFEIFINGKLFETVSLFSEVPTETSNVANLILDSKLNNVIKIVNKSNKKINFDFFSRFNEAI